jgi:hypothetical protein
LDAIVTRRRGTAGNAPAPLPKAVVRARVLYFTEIGYFALEVYETLVQRQELLCERAGWDPVQIIQPLRQHHRRVR